MEGKRWWTSAMSGGIVRWRILARLRPTACWRQSIIVQDDELPNSPPSRGLAPSLRGDMAGNVCLCPPRTCSLCPPRTCTHPSRGLAPSLRGDMAENAASVRTGHAHLPLGTRAIPSGRHGQERRLCPRRTCANPPYIEDGTPINLLLSVQDMHLSHPPGTRQWVSKPPPWGRLISAQHHISVRHGRHIFVRHGQR